MNRALRSELGQEAKKESKSIAKETKKEVNPVEERYANTKGEEPSLIWTLLKVILVFGILTAALYYVLKYVSKNREAQFPVRGVMKTLSVLPLAPNKQLQIVDLSGTLLLLGISDHSVNLIKEIDENDLKEKIYQAQENFLPPQENFLEVLLKSAKGVADIKNPNPPFVEKETQAETNALQKAKTNQMERLRRLKEERSSLLKDSSYNFGDKNET